MHINDLFELSVINHVYGVDVFIKIFQTLGWQTNAIKCVWTKRWFKSDYTKIIWPWNLHKTGHASLINPGAACIDYHPVQNILIRSGLFHTWFTPETCLKCMQIKNFTCGTRLYMPDRKFTPISCMKNFIYDAALWVDLSHLLFPTHFEPITSIKTTLIFWWM